MCILEGGTGVNSQTSPVPLPQKLISSRPNPTKKLEENPAPLPEEWLPFPPTPVLLFFLLFIFLPKSVSYSKNIVQITACPPY